MPFTPNPRDFYPAVFARTKLLLMPSLWLESFGLVAAEAMLNGIPVLASNRGALPETIGSAGFLLDIPARYTSETRDVPTAKRSRRRSRRSFAFGTMRRTTSIAAVPPAGVPRPGIPTALRRSTATSSAAWSVSAFHRSSPATSHGNDWHPRRFLIVHSMAIVRYLTIRRNRRKSAPFCAKVCNARPSAVARDASGNDNSRNRGSHSVRRRHRRGGLYWDVPGRGPLPRRHGDPNFQQWDASGAISSASSVVIQPNNMILVGGTFVVAEWYYYGVGARAATTIDTPNNASYSLGVARFNVNGSLDTSFNSGASFSSSAGYVTDGTGYGIGCGIALSPTAVLSWREASVIPPTRSSRRTCRWWSG